jgi:hypothetical protein
MNLAAVFFFSLSTLGIEVLLTRIFAISQWHSLAFMVISLVLFGFAAGGTLLSLRQARRKQSYRYMPIILSWLTALYCASVIGSFWWVNHMPLDYFLLPLDSSQILYLMLAYLFLAVPFFLAGIVLSASFAAAPKLAGLIYAAAMGGSAVGALIPLILLPLIKEVELLLVCALTPLLALPWYIKDLGKDYLNLSKSGRLKAWIGISLCLINVVVGVILFNTSPPSLMHISSTPYKALYQLLELPGSQIKTTFRSIRGKLDVVTSPYVRFAPGLSLKFNRDLPPQWAVFKDNDRPFIFYDYDDEDRLEFTRFMLLHAGYINKDPNSVLIIQRGGGTAIPAALSSGAKNITILEANPQLADLIAQHYPINVVCAAPRVFLSQNKNRYTHIHIENWGYSIPGTAALTSEYELTSEAVTSYLKHLAKDGVLIFTRKILLPPRDMPRLYATLYKALQNRGSKEPSQHLAVLRNWDTYTLLAFARPLKETHSLRTFARKMNFDLVFLHDLEPEETNHFNIYEKPFHYQALQDLQRAYENRAEQAFFKTHSLDIAPQSDHRPFQNRFMKWSRLKAIYDSTGKRFYTVLMSGEMVIAIVFAEALLVAFLLLGLPVLILRKMTSPPNRYIFGYFFAVGSGFIMVEIFLINWYTLLFGDPVISFTIVLTGLLIFSGMGGLWSLRLSRSALKMVLTGLLVILVILILFDHRLLKIILNFSAKGRIISAFFVMLPLGILMGIPFSIGMRDLTVNPVQRTYAWSINGCASVLLSIVSAQIGISMGFTYIIVGAAAAYVLAYVCEYRSTFYENKLT